jgi:uncharacterized protein DUF6641
MEVKMAILKSLPLTTLPTTGANPTLDRRARIIARLEEQKFLLADPGYTRTVRSWVKQNGEKTQVEKQQRVLPSWRLAANGSYVFFVRVGQKALEFDKGKSAIAVPSLDKLPPVIDALISAVRGGELDEQLAQASKAAVVGGSKRRAA